MGTLAQLRNSILTSLQGRRIGLDTNDFLKGPKDLTRAIQAELTSGSTGTAIINYGITPINITTASASTASSVGTTEIGRSWTMDAPEPGVQKIVYNSNTTGSTASIVVEFGTGVTAASASFGTTFTGFTMWAGGQAVQLMGISTAKWIVTAVGTGTSFASSN